MNFWRTGRSTELVKDKLSRELSSYRYSFLDRMAHPQFLLELSMARSLIDDLGAGAVKSRKKNPKASPEICRDSNCRFDALRDLGSGREHVVNRDLLGSAAEGDPPFAKQ